MARRFTGGSGRRMVRHHRSPLWHLGLSGLLVAAAVAAVLYLQWQRQPPDPPPVPEASLPPDTDVQMLTRALREQVNAALEERGIWAELIHQVHAFDRTPGVHALDTIAVRVPADLPLEDVNSHLTGLVQRGGGQVLRAVERQRGQRVEMRCGLDTVATTLFVLRHAPQLLRRAGKIALVLDDFGHQSTHLIERFTALPQPLTLAVLPNEGQVEDIVEQARDHGHEVLVHLPMEPDDYPERNPGENAIFIDQKAEKIRQLARAAIRRIPGAVGLNNHMGSRATTDPRVMKQVLLEVKKHDLIFLDSRTSPGSVAGDLARTMDIPAFRRDLFIDPVDEVAAVEVKLWELAAVAARNSQAIGIGHDREQTLQAMQAVLPRLEARGFRFVPISQLTP